VRSIFDHLGKQIGQEALGPSGPTVAHDEIAPAPAINNARTVGRRGILSFQ
jgi:hypothetical protein